MSQQVFCGRPGCGMAKSAHGLLAGACSNFIYIGSAEANRLARAHLSVVETPVPEPIEEEKTEKIAPPQRSPDALMFDEWKARLAEVLAS